MDNKLSNISLAELMLGIVLFLFIIPGLGCGLLNRVDKEGSQKRLERQQKVIQSLDEEINNGNAVRKVVTDTTTTIEQEFYMGQDLIAKDFYSKNENEELELKKRDYYDEQGNIIASDLFVAVSNIQISGIYINGIVKHREYYNQDKEIYLREYFDENGIGYPKMLSTQGGYELRQNTMRSPFPPLFIFYR